MSQRRSSHARTGFSWKSSVLGFRIDSRNSRGWVGMPVAQFLVRSPTVSPLCHTVARAHCMYSPRGRLRRVIRYAYYPHVALTCTGRRDYRSKKRERVLPRCSLLRTVHIFGSHITEDSVERTHPRRTAPEEDLVRARTRQAPESCDMLKRGEFYFSLCIPVYGA